MQRFIIYQFVLILLAFGWPGATLAQTYVSKDDVAFPSNKRIFHYVNDDQPLQAGEIKELPVTQRRPIAVAAKFHPREVAESERAYAEGRFSDAAETVADLAKLNPPDPTVLNCYARALYRVGATRNQSYPVYQRLIALLDSYGQEGPQVVSIYTPFLEAYFKLATLQLDRKQWAAATYNLSRTAGALQALPKAASENQALREQILQYQTECFARLENAELCRYFGQRTLQFFPDNQYVGEYLAALPPAAAKVPTRR